MNKIKIERNYKLSTEMAYSFLVEEGITSFPIDVLKIVNKHKWGITTFDELANKLNISYELLKMSLDNCWGTVHYNGLNYAIAYDNRLCKGAQYFTILHEIGHICMKHLDSEGCIKVYCNDIELGSKEVYEKMEDEANCFARNVAAPIILLDELKINPVENWIIKNFGLTKKAAKARIDFTSVDRYYSKSVDRYTLLKNCSTFLSSLEHPSLLRDMYHQQDCTFLKPFEYIKEAL